MKKISLLLFFAVIATALNAQTDNGVMSMDEFRNATTRKFIDIPEVDGYQTLKCDFHVHTVFSDGLVWPTIRVEEAWGEGLDAIAITDHIEYQPHSEDIVVNHNRGFALAKEDANACNLVLIKGTEITRRTPPGHFNAIFIGDASGYIEARTDNSKDKLAISRATEQNGFIFWNHPGWKADKVDGSYEWIDFVDDLNNEKMLHGIEVFNGFSFHKKSLDWCMDKNLTVLGTSDIHNLISHDYKNDEDVHRTMTLVFAKEKTASSIREALEAGRTVAWSSKYLAGKEENIRALFNACVKIGTPYFTTTHKGKEGTLRSIKYYEIRNNSDLYFHLKSDSDQSQVVLAPKSMQRITTDAEQSSLTYEVVNTFIRSNKHLSVTFSL
jgi:hypothetical protein